MRCCTALYAPTPDGDTIFEVEAPRIKYGRGALGETGAEAAALGIRRAALFTDPGVARAGYPQVVLESLQASGIEVEVFDRVRVEPTNLSFDDAIAFARDARVDGYVSVGGGSAIDTAKAANLYTTYPASFRTYVNAPVGDGAPVPGPLKPHIACPTTAGTGAECTGMAIFDDLNLGAKTGIASKRLRPVLGIVDPDVTRTLPATVVAAAGFDVLSHALESYTARPYVRRPKPQTPISRPLSQGANPFSDIACAQALRLIGTHIVRAVADRHDDEAREKMMFAATLAGIGFGNSGVHVPHAMAYAVAGLVRRYHAPDYPGDDPIVPHGISVIVNTPAVVRFTSSENPERHREAASYLGGESDALDAQAGEALAHAVIALMRATAMPSGLRDLGYDESSIDALTRGTLPQERLLANAPRSVGRGELEALFAGALHY